MNRKLILGMLSLLSLVLGVNIYTDFRFMGTRAFYQINDFIPIDLQRWFPDMVENEFFLYNLPDLLWMYAFLGMIPLIWGFRFSKEMIGWALGAITLGLAYESSQYFELIGGTFDKMDMLSLLLAICLSILTYLSLKFGL